MKCEDLRELLESNDEKNARIKANTIECFEQIKDFVVDDLVQKSIESNFSKYGNHLNGCKIYEKLFEIKEISTKFISDMYLYGSGWEDCYTITHSSFFGELDQNQQAEYTENRFAIKTFFSEFDRSLFKSLIESHVQSIGFKEVTAETISGRRFKTGAFYASRSTIEKMCCPNTKPSQADDSKEMNDSIVFAVVIIAMLLIAASFIIL